jgi:hypothetical protein
MYPRVREIFAMAADYSPTLPETTRFFRFIQNKLHFAVTGKTAAELIAGRADSRLPNMGLTTWKADSVRKADVTVAKNYPHEPEILITYQFQGEAIKRPVGAGFSPRKSRAKARSYGHMWQTDRWRAHHPKKKQLDRNLQDKQDDAIYRKCEFIRTQRPE